MRRGFTLVQISIILTIASLVMVAILPSDRAKLTSGNATITKINSIMSSLRAYESTYASLPCPADASMAISSTNYGVAAVNIGTGSPGNCTGGTPAANYSDTGNHVAVGMVPVRALGLSNDYALDAYGRTITYAVDTNATMCFQGSLAGQITVTDNSVANSSIVALVSHGPNGHGAWIPLPGTSGTATRLNAGSTDTSELLNAHVNSSFVPYSSPLNNFVRKSPTSTFDDLVVYQSNLWNINNEPVAAANAFPSMISPSSGTYQTSQTLTFTVTFPNNVTVTGTPRLDLTFSSGAAYANYASGSGTKILTFTHTVASTDYAPSPTGTSITSPIDMNGGSIYMGAIPACPVFTVPSLTGVLVNPYTIYAVDSNNNRVNILTLSSGAFVGQFPCSSGVCTGNSTAGNLHSPAGVAVDSGNNVWVIDAGNSRVNKYDVYGNYQSVTFGGHGTSTGVYSGIATDASGNVWVADGKTQVQEYNSSGVWMATLCNNYFGASPPTCVTGSATGYFNKPVALTFDPSGNLWVVDQANDRVQEFNSSGAFVQTFGSSAAGNYQFTTPAGIAYSVPNSLVYVTDPPVKLLKQFNTSGIYTGDCGYFSTFYGVTVDANGNIWVGDVTDAAVVELNPATGAVVTGYGGSGAGNGQFSVTNTSVTLAIGTR